MNYEQYKATHSKIGYVLTETEFAKGIIAAEQVTKMSWNQLAYYSQRYLCQQMTEIAGKFHSYNQSEFMAESEVTSPFTGETTVFRSIF